jgi:hypothetical protein
MQPSFIPAFNKLISEKPSQLILGIVFILYILLNVQTPAFLAEPIDTIFGKVIVVVIAIIVFMHTNPVIGVLGFIVAYQMIKTASVTTGRYAMQHYLPSEDNKAAEMAAFNERNIHASGSLEEEMVEKMAPLVLHGGNPNIKFVPILAGQHSAASLDYNDTDSDSD